MQLSNVVMTFVLRAMNVPKRTANTMPTISAGTPHAILRLPAWSSSRPSSVRW
jgi:hypothetical protein